MQEQDGWKARFEAVCRRYTCPILASFISVAITVAGLVWMRYQSDTRGFEQATQTLALEIQKVALQTESNTAALNADRVQEGERYAATSEILSAIRSDLAVIKFRLDGNTARSAESSTVATSNDP
jgi:aspartate carbamoyltransferase catalytic subunit